MEKVRLNNIAVLVLFITSYIPLFGLLIIRQVKQNIEYFNFGGISAKTLIDGFEKFGLSALLLVIAIFGLVGLKFLLNNLDSGKNNGDLVLITEIENKNSESIGYISTYIVPFIFQDTNNYLTYYQYLLCLRSYFYLYKIKYDCHKSFIKYFSHFVSDRLQQKEQN